MIKQQNSIPSINYIFTSPNFLRYCINQFYNPDSNFLLHFLPYFLQPISMGNQINRPHYEQTLTHFTTNNLTNISSNNQTQNEQNPSQAKIQLQSINKYQQTSNNIDTFNIQIITTIKQNSIKTLPQHYPHLLLILPKSVIQWYVIDTVTWLSYIGLSSLSQNFNKMTIDGSCLLLLDQRDLFNQLNIKSSITIGIIMTWVEVGFKQYDRYLRQHLTKKNNKDQFIIVNNFQRIDKMINIIKNIQLNIPTSSINQQFIKNNQQQQYFIPTSYLKTYKFNTKSQLTYNSQINNCKINNLSIQSSNNQNQNNYQNQRNQKQKLSQHLSKENINKIKTLELFDKSTNLCIQINQFPYYLITQLDKINKDIKNYYHIPPLKNIIKSNYIREILNINDGKQEYNQNKCDENDNEKRINKNLQKCFKRTLREQISYFLPSNSTQHQNSFYQNPYQQTKNSKKNSQNPLSNIASSLNLSKLYNRDVLNTQIIITKQQEQQNNPSYYFSLIIKCSPNFYDHTLLRHTSSLKDIQYNNYKFSWNCKKYEEHGNDSNDQISNKCIDKEDQWYEVYDDRDSSYSGNNFKNNQCCDSQLLFQKEEQDQQCCYQQQQYQEETNGNEYQNIDKNKQNKPKKHIKTSNKYTIFNPQVPGSTTYLYNTKSNQDISIYMLLKQAIAIPQNQYNTLDIHNYQNKQNKIDNKNIKTPSHNTAEYYYNKYKFVIENYEFIPEFYLQRYQNSVNSCLNLKNIDENNHNTHYSVIMILSTMNGKTKLQLFPQYENTNIYYVGNHSYHCNISSSSQHYSIFFLCVDPFTKSPILKQLQAEQTISTYLQQCRYKKLAAILYVNHQKQYYLCNVNDIEGLIYKKIKEINKKYKQSKSDEDKLWMGQEEEQIYRKQKKIGKNKGDARTCKQQFSPIAQANKTPTFRYKYNKQQHTITPSQIKTTTKPPTKIWTKLPIQLLQIPKPLINTNNTNINIPRKQQQINKIIKQLKTKIKIKNNCTLKIGTRQIIFNINVKNWGKNNNVHHGNNWQEQNYINRHVNNIIQHNQLYNLDETNNNKYISNINHQQHVLSSPFYNKCILCCSRPNNCIYLQCKHNVTCLTCGKLLDHCPICRQPIHDYVRIYS